jgi:hypothetical protein
MDILVTLLTACSSIATILTLITVLRKMEFGEFSIFRSHDKIELDARLKVIKSDIFNITITFTSSDEVKRVMQINNGETNTYFTESGKNFIEIPKLSEETILICSNIHTHLKITYFDRYGNKFSQTIDESRKVISPRKLIKLKLVF